MDYLSYFGLGARFSSFSVDLAFPCTCRAYGGSFRSQYQLPAIIVFASFCPFAHCLMFWVTGWLTYWQENCGYPTVCGRYGICTSNWKCSCPPERNFFRPLDERKIDVGCLQLTSIYCNSSQYPSYVELKNTTYFAFEFSDERISGILPFERKKLEDCKGACLRNCSCKAVVFRYDSDGASTGSCLLLNEVFSLVDTEDGMDKRVFLKVQNSSNTQNQWIYHKNEENGLRWHTRLRIITDIAKGLAYLHDECSQKTIHSDIKPQNILLDKNFNAKISDFGLSKLINKDESKVLTRMRGTPGHLAPEWLRSVITEKVDVYAFGIVLLELLCGRKNLDRSQADEDVHLLSVFERKSEQQQLMGDFTKRPSISLVVKALECLVSVETNLDYDFTSLPEVAADNEQSEDTL
ncbi:hypothetical protein KY289_031492 [Solanum tuberosum]|nr:hypothetical protein KY289_031492 [Solanum tuberosum]